MQAKVIVVCFAVCQYVVSFFFHIVGLFYSLSFLIDVFIVFNFHFYLLLGVPAVVVILFVGVNDSLSAQSRF